MTTERRLKIPAALTRLKPTIVESTTRRLLTPRVQTSARGLQEATGEDAVVLGIVEKAVRRALSEALDDAKRELERSVGDYPWEDAAYGAIKKVAAGADYKKFVEKLAHEVYVQAQDYKNDEGADDE